MHNSDPALDDLFSATYEELRRLATSVKRDDPAATLNPTTLVHEAYLKLAASRGLRPESRLHFKRLAARAMRQVLVEAARRRKAAKRGGSYAFVTFDDRAGVGEPAGEDEILALDLALDRLAQLEPRQAELVVCRFFGGLDARETAAALAVSESTLLRDWRAARAWLATQLRPAS
jgi:RNA polymerase sigma factor (TIGR02999 family)